MAELIVALDYTEAPEALHMAETLRGNVNWVKTGVELFTSEGPQMVRTLKAMGFKVMLDLKLFDIPNTVRGGVRAACRVGADLITLHLLGGERMIRAAADEAACAGNGAPLLFGVTVLTSMAQGELPGYTGDITALAGDLAAKAAAWGLHGVVCSGHEAAGIKQRCPGLRCLTPGIRLDAAAGDDQRRIMTPDRAVAAGADFLVVGRPVTRADDPAAAAKAVRESMARA